MRDRKRKFQESISFLITDEMYDELEGFAKKRKLSLSKVARDVMHAGMKVLAEDVGNSIDGSC